MFLGPENEHEPKFVSYPEPPRVVPVPEPPKDKRILLVVGATEWITVEPKNYAIDPGFNEHNPIDAARADAMGQINTMLMMHRTARGQEIVIPDDVGVILHTDGRVRGHFVTQREVDGLLREYKYVVIPLDEAIRDWM